MSFLNDITIGQYYPVNSFVHRLDPRTKLILMIVGMTVLLLCNELVNLWLACVLLLVAVKISNVPLSLLFRNLRPFMWLFGITFIVHVFFSDNVSDYKIPLINIYLSKQGVISGIIYSLRLALLIIFAALLTLTTSPIEITDALEKMLSPLKKIRIPTHELILMMTLSLRFIPTLLMEAEKLRKAQISRGVSFSGNIVQRVKNIVPLILPLFLSVFRRADELALAMDSRCYTGGEGRTRYKELQFGKSDFYVLIGSAFFLIIFFLI